MNIIRTLENWIHSKHNILMNHIHDHHPSIKEDLSKLKDDSDVEIIARYAKDLKPEQLGYMYGFNDILISMLSMKKYEGTNKEANKVIDDIINKLYEVRHKKLIKFIINKT